MCKCELSHLWSNKEAFVVQNSLFGLKFPINLTLFSSQICIVFILINISPSVSFFFTYDDHQSGILIMFLQDTFYSL